MGRSRDKSPAFLDDLFALLLVVPVWVGPLLAVGSYAAARWFLPWALSPSDPNNVTASTVSKILSGVGPMLAPWIAGLVVLVWLTAEGRKWSDRRRLDRQTGLDSLRNMTWQQFERLVGEAFRRQGYKVEHTGTDGPDGGLDLRLRKPGEIVLVQCKHWKTDKVGVPLVRELNGLIADEHATAGILVTIGDFTPDAVAFARRNPVTLLNGQSLARLIRDVQTSPPPLPQPESQQHAPACPTCGSSMHRRTASKGRNVGSTFWGCSRFPACRGTREI